MQWLVREFAALTVDEVYAILRLRSEVFVVEQKCAYQDIDGLDREALHVFAVDGGEVLACARIFAPGVREAAARIGRVVTAPSLRKSGVGKELMARSLAAIEERWGAVRIRLNAQKYIERFYAGFGFAPDGAEFLEDDILHVPMARPEDWK
jgi:ElaA protein